jgi:hypothetical protein
MNLTDEFLNTVNAVLELVETLGQDHPETNRALMLAMELAPAEMIADLGQMAREMGLMPEPCYLEDGTKVFPLESVAAHLGLTLDEAEESMHEMLAQRESLGLPNDGIMRIDPDSLHRAH